jgi:hypothetical protein
VGLRSASGYFRRTSCVGVMLFLQYWYWYPLSYCLSLALQPSAFIGLNADLKLPKMQVKPQSLLTSCVRCRRIIVATQGASLYSEGYLTDAGHARSGCLWDAYYPRWQGHMGHAHERLRVQSAVLHCVGGGQVQAVAVCVPKASHS